MCGGRGTRLDSATEKPLHEIRGVSLVDRVIAAVRESRVNDVYAVTSPQTPGTRRHLEHLGTTAGVIDAPGEGYVVDLQYALDQVPGESGDDGDAEGRAAGDSEPVLTVAADLPLLVGDAIDRVLDVYDAGSLTVCSPAVLPQTLGVTTDATFELDGRVIVPTGVNVVGGDPDESWVTWDARFAVNVNYPEDAAVAERLLSGPPE